VSQLANLPLPDGVLHWRHKISVRRRIGEMKGRWLKLPVILATGFAELPPDIDPLQQITLAKPFLQYDLEQAVNAALEDQKKRRVVRFRRGL
jgi:FixJ family two-component response regulator